MTNYPVKYIGPMSIRRGPIAHLPDVEAAAKLEMQRDLRTAPTPLSGGMRKALHKETGSQNALRYRVNRKHGEFDFRKCYGLFLARCRCGHQMYFDDVGDSVSCDRCGRVV